MQVAKGGFSDIGYLKLIVINYRLARIMVSKGKSDIIFSINHENVESVENLLTSMNPYFETVIKECSVNDVVTFPDFITKTAFLELEKYYSGGIIKVTFENVYELLEISSFVKDDELLGICSQYIVLKIIIVI